MGVINFTHFCNAHIGIHCYGTLPKPVSSPISKRSQYSLPHVQPLPEDQSFQADQCYQMDHGHQGHQKGQLYQAHPEYHINDQMRTYFLKKSDCVYNITQKLYQSQDDHS